MAASRILLISDSGDAAVGTALERPGHALTRVESADAGAGTAGDFDVVIIDLDGPSRRTVDACRAIRETAALTTVPILALSHTDDVEGKSVV